MSAKHLTEYADYYSAATIIPHSTELLKKKEEKFAKAE